MDALNLFLNTVRVEFEKSLSVINRDDLEKASELIWEAEKNKNRIHITGIGKPGHVAGYIASLMS
ncbi:MAG TPA: carbohydrate isomerase, partial [Thermoclostridium caenicola]|nr:carbohydrate isomerase [Thermoclostridium caenicola]